MNAEFVFGFQVIPSLLGQPVNGDEKPSSVFAYVSVEDTKVQENKPKALRGQIRKCNLTEYRAGGLILGEVLRYVTLYYKVFLFHFILFCALCFLITLYDFISPNESFFYAV